MSDPSKKAARAFDFQAMLAQARAGAQERSSVDWDKEIEKTKEENESRIVEMKSKAEEAAKKMQAAPPTTITSHFQPAEDDDDDFGPSLDLATKKDNDGDENSSSDDDDDRPAEVKNWMKRIERREKVFALLVGRRQSTQRR